MSIDSRKRKTTSNDLSLSVADLYNLVESQRKWTKTRNRLQSAKSALVSQSPEMFSPLPGIAGRTNTSVSEPGLPSKEKQMTMLKPPLTPMSCLRSESIIKDEYFKIVSSLCRQCCDVLGPTSCHQCIKVNDRREHLRRTGNLYSNLEASEENVTSSNTLKKYLPNLTMSEIQDTIAMGQIARNSVNSELQHRRELSMLINENVPSPAISKPLKTKVVLQNENSTQAFFVNIKALNAKIVSGEVPKDLKSFSKMTMKSNGLSDKEALPNKNVSFSESVCPTFVSPRKQAKEKQIYSAYFSPPLLPLQRQNVEPMFFAGSNKAYILPDRLPDKVVPGQDAPEVLTYAEMSSSPEISMDSRPSSKTFLKLPSVPYSPEMVEKKMQK